MDPRRRPASHTESALETEPTAESWGLTTTTVGDQLRLLQALTADSSVLGPEARAYVFGLMGSVAADQDWGMSAAADTDETVLKNGWLPRDATGLWVVNSIGRIDHDGHELLVAVVSDDQPSQAAGIKQVETAVKAAVEAVAAGTAEAAG